jgi:LPS-assembly lipoprotein
MSWSEARRPAIVGLGMFAGGDEQSSGPRVRGGNAPACRSRRGRLLAALALSGGLAACGFRLRGTQQLPFETLFIDARPASTFGIELARSVRTGTTTRVAADRAAAQAQLEILSESRERSVLSVNAQGRAREYQLHLRVAFRVHDGKGREFIGPTTIGASRDLAVSEAQILARETEEAQLYLDMQNDLVQQILRRLSVLKP